jgi:hypothetical protein
MNILCAILCNKNLLNAAPAIHSSPLRAAIISARKNQNTIGWKRKRSRMAELMERLRLRKDTATVADHSGINPVLIDVAIENLAPETATWEPDAIPKAIEGPEMDDHNHVVAFTFHPPMKRQHAVLIVYVNNAKALAAQALKTPA